MVLKPRHMSNVYLASLTLPPLNLNLKLKAFAQLTLTTSSPTMASDKLDNCPEKLPRYSNHDGYLVAGGFPVDGFRSALKYQAQDNDLFIVTYPKVCAHLIVLEQIINADSSSSHKVLHLYRQYSYSYFSAVRHGHNTLCI